MVHRIATCVYAVAADHLYMLHLNNITLNVIVFYELLFTSEV